MTEQEAIERIYSKLMNGTPRDKDACDIAIDDFEKSYHYRAMERRLKAVYGDYDNLPETVVEGFCRHSGVDIGTPAKSRLLTDEDADKWDAYRAIGTVEECREAVEMHKPKVGIVKVKSYPIMCPRFGHKMDLAYHYCVFCGQCLIYLQKHE